MKTINKDINSTIIMTIDAIAIIFLSVVLKILKRSVANNAPSSKDEINNKTESRTITNRLNPVFALSAMFAVKHSR